MTRVLVRQTVSHSLTPQKEFGKVQIEALHTMGFSYPEVRRIINAGSVAVAVWAVEFVVDLARDGCDKKLIYDWIERVRQSVCGVQTFRELFPECVEIPTRFSIPQILWAFLDSAKEALDIGLPMQLIEEED